MIAPVLIVRDLSAQKAGAVVLEELSLKIEAGQILTLVGANGAGKSTALRCLIGLDAALAGSIKFNGVDIANLSVERRARAGIGYCPEGRRVFPGLTVLETLQLAWRGPSRERRTRVQALYDLFPALAEKADEPAWRLSGGQQQMLAIARALVPKPKLLLLDEPSLGLSPLMLNQMFEAVREIASTGTAILLAEQNIARALSVADHALALERGRTVFSGAPSDLRTLWADKLPGSG